MESCDWASETRIQILSKQSHTTSLRRMAGEKPRHVIQSWRRRRRNCRVFGCLELCQQRPQPRSPSPIAQVLCNDVLFLLKQNQSRQKLMWDRMSRHVSWKPTWWLRRQGEYGSGSHSYRIVELMKSRLAVMLQQHLSVANRFVKSLFSHRLDQTKTSNVWKIARSTWTHGNCLHKNGNIMVIPVPLVFVPTITDPRNSMERSQGAISQIIQPWSWVKVVRKDVVWETFRQILAFADFSTFGKGVVINRYQNWCVSASLDFLMAHFERGVRNCEMSKAEKGLLFPMSEP